MSSIESIRVPVVALPVLLFSAFLPASVAQAQPSSPSASPWPYDNVALPGGAPALPSDEPPRPPEPASARFGAQGQFVLGGGTNLGLYSTQWDSSAATDFNVGFSPEFDYFVFKNFSIGLDLSVSYDDSRGYDASGSLTESKTTSFSAGPRFGFNIPLGSAVSWWPQATFDIASNRWSTNVVTPYVSNPPAPTSTSQDGPTVNLYLPLLVHPVPHFFMGAGPSLFHAFGAVRGGSNVGDQATTIGGGFLVGGYWGGTPEKTVAAASDAPPRPLTHFGDQGHVVFSNELAGAMASTSFAGTTDSAFNGQFTLGVDYFFVDHFSIGADLAGTWSNSSSTDATGSPVTNSTSGFGVGVRLGAQIPIAGPVSLYPRVALNGGGGGGDEKSATGEDSYSQTEVWVSRYVPVIVEVAPHLFVGLGPSARRDLANTYSNPQGQQQSNPGSTIGAGFIVGGWL